MSLTREFKRYDLLVVDTESDIVQVYLDGLESFYDFRFQVDTGQWVGVPRVRTVFLEIPK